MADILVSAPRRQQYPFGLFSAVQIQELPPHGGVGVQFEELPCGGVGAVGGNCFVTDAANTSVYYANKQNLLSLAQPETTKGISFAVAAGVDCGIAGYTPEQFLAMAEENLILNQERVVEQVVLEWLNTSGNVITLDPLPNVNTGTQIDIAVNVAPEDYRHAVAQLELFNSYEGFGMRGTLWMNRGLAQYGLSVRALEHHGGRLYTQLGTPVVAAGGWFRPGIGTTAEQIAMAYTGPISVLRGQTIPFTDPAQPFDTLNRNTNELQKLAEANFAVLIPKACPTALIPYQNNPHE